VGVAGVTSKLLPIYQLQVLQQTIFYVKKRNKRPFTKVKSTIIKILEDEPATPLKNFFYSAGVGTEEVS